MEPISLMGIFVIAAKGGLAILSVVGVASSMEWMNKKMFRGKKGGDNNASPLQAQKVHRDDFE